MKHLKVEQNKLKENHKKAYLKWNAFTLSAQA